MQVLGGDATISQRRVRRSTVCGHGNGAKAENRPRRADQSVEACGGNAVEVVADFLLDVTDELAFVARLYRIALYIAFGEPDDAHLEAASQLDL